MRAATSRLLTSVLALLTSLSCLAQGNWKPAASPLSTPWTAMVSPENALPEYPRPQMSRTKWLSLNGLWEFMALDQKSDKVVRQGSILVPYPVESALSGVGMKVEPHHLLVYRKKVTLPNDWAGQRILLHFGAVDWETEVLVNGKSAGKHRGGYDAFSFDITDLLSGSGPQDITVQVSDPTDAGEQPVGKQTLQPRGIWYTATSGIWQTTWLEPVPKTYIKSLELLPDLDQRRVFLKVEVAGEGKDKTRVTARALDNRTRVSEGSAKAGTPLLLGINNPRPWSPSDPYLYDLEVELSSGDKVSGYFGLRKVSLGKDSAGFTRILLNNEFLFQLGPLDQGFFPDGLYTPPSEQAMLHDLNTLKSLGFNMIRKHVKVEPERWYYLCDKMGFLVWQDMPSARNGSEAARSQFMAELQAMVTNLVNHPSIIMWVPFNEGWGQFNTPEVVTRIKQWDDSRLVNNASGWTDMQVGDLIDIHEYPGPGAPRPEERRASVLGEFGGLGLNVEGHQWTTGGWGYELKSSPEELLEKYEELYRGLLPLVQSQGLSAAVYTQTSDIETENNGLMTYDRKLLKMDPQLARLAHDGKMPPRPTNTARIFHRDTDIALECIAPGAAISYAIAGKKQGLKWKSYDKPFNLRKSTTIHCRATWPDSSESRTQQFSFEKVKALAPVASGKQPPAGILRRLYRGSWDKLPDVSSLAPVEQSVVQGIDLAGFNLTEDFAAVFEGYLEVPQTGVYTFHLRSDDGSRLAVGGQVLMDNDGLHGMKGGTASIALKKGKHALRLEYFQKKEGLGLEFFLLDGQGRRLPPSWFH